MIPTIPNIQNKASYPLSYITMMTYYDTVEIVFSIHKSIVKDLNKLFLFCYVICSDVFHSSVTAI